uniref:Endonuclease/exonuclease/phosphatase domain-containing protein n=2 Tax=Graphocephala atropunctata TaxID=36148 RepID=A0A1B6KFW4_9HEMI
MGNKITDHKLIFCDLNCEGGKRLAKLITYRDYSHLNLNEMLNMMAEVNWNYVAEILDVNDMNDFISTNIKQIFDRHAPLVTKRVTKKKAPWRNEEIKHLTKLKNNLRNKYQASRQTNDWVEYKTVRNQLNFIIRRAKKSFFERNLSNCKNSKEFWNSLRKGDVVGNKNYGHYLPVLKDSEINKSFVDMGSFYEADKELEEFL